MTERTELKEGRYFQYKLLKLIQLGENESYFMLTDEFGRKQLMNAEHYVKYNFKIGDKIRCRIDHINCSGKIFLEPEHPHYKEGETYSFTVDQSYIFKNKFGENVRLLEVKDVFDELAKCIVENKIENFEPGKQIKCIVERIKKAKLYLRYADDTSYSHFEIGKYYLFNVKEIKILSDGLKYYILTDNNQNKHLLKYEYYNHHKIEIGDDIECIIQKFSSKGYYVLEPKHPYYEISKEYEFKFDRQFSSEKDELTGTYEVVVIDTFDEEVRFSSDKKIEHTGKIRCKITGIKKGKPIPVLID